MKTTLQLVAAVGLLMTSAGQVVACSCPQSQGANEEERQRWLLDRAAHVVKARVTSVRAGDDTKFNGYPVVAATLNVVSVVKGDVPLGEVKVFTGFGTGDCGIAQGLLTGGIAFKREITVQLNKSPDVQDAYGVDMCGYLAFSSFDPKANEKR